MKVLYVEDHPEQRNLLKQLLEVSGYSVVLAGNGTEGLEKAKEELPDVILMDLRMPHVDGYDAIKSLKGDPAVSSIPIIAISAWGASFNRRDALSAGAARFLLKPVEISDLIAVIEDLLSSDDG